MKSIAPSLRKSWFVQTLILGMLLPGLCLFPVPILANPTGGVVVNGNVSFSGVGTGNLTINQGSNLAIINWQDFSIASGEITTFNQPGVNSLALNRVVTGNPSQILGQLSANGGLFIVNPNGIFVGPGGSVDVAGMLTMSTLDITNEDFLDGGTNRFQGNTTAGIVNYGAISSANGDVVLLGNFLQNAGSVSAPDGVVAFGAGGDIIVEQNADGSTISVRGGGPGGVTGIENSGDIYGSAAEFKAHGNSYALAVQNTGVVRANGYNFSGGRLTLSAGSTGSVVNTGELFARQSSGAGGNVTIEGSSVQLSGGRVDVSGAPGQAGGSVNVVATDVAVSDTASISADGSSGGSVSLLGSNTLTMDGDVSAVGNAGSGGQVDLTAAQVNVGSTTTIDASGLVGGQVRVGGGYRGEEADIANASDTTIGSGSVIIADGSDGDAGRVIVWADEGTLFEGYVSAQATGAVGNGGFVEVSGAESLRFRGMANTSSLNGETGTLLLDPADVEISEAATATILISTLVGAAHQETGFALASGTVVDTNRPIASPGATGLIHANHVVIHTSGSGGAGNINIGVGVDNADDIHYNAPNSLTFLAHGDIIVNANLLNHSDSGGNLTLLAGWDGVDPIGVTTVAPTNTSATNFSFAEALQFSWGNAGGDVIIGGIGGQEVSVASRTGETNVLGNSVLVNTGGDSEFGQIGYRNYLLIDEFALHSSGDINVRANQTISLVTNTTADPQNAHVMIGHGGSNDAWLTGLENNGTVGNPTQQFRNTANAANNGEEAFRAAGRGNMSGNITVMTDGTLAMRGSDDRSFAQIGHGGVGSSVGNRENNADGTVTFGGD
ncbi:MAG: filamentous hemagglutinin N-terminal domain-containing protein, partial [Verrucomicrobiota bacterium]